MKHTYRGVHMAKNPFDLALYQLLLWELRPGTIIEIGTKKGGSALWFRDQARRAMKMNTEVVSIDPFKRPGWSASGITFIDGDARELEGAIGHMLSELGRPWLVVEDSSHHYDVVKASVDYFAPKMGKGEYLVVEDGVMEAWGNSEQYDGGPPRVISEFLEEHPEWEIDERLADYYGFNVTWAVNGWLTKT